MLCLLTRISVSLPAGCCMQAQLRCSALSKAQWRQPSAVLTHELLAVQLMEVHGDYSAEVAPDVGTAIERPAGEGEEEAAPAEEGADWS